MPKPYPAAFRRQALALLDGGRTVRDVAASLGIAESCLHRWKRQQRVDQGFESGTSDADRSELAAAKQRIRDLEEEVKILRKAAAAVDEVVPPKERFRLVAELAAEGVRVRRACYWFGVSPSGFYDWQARPPSSRSIRHAWLTDVITAVHAETRGTYGSERIHAEMVHGHGLRIGHNTVGLLMRRAGLTGLPVYRRRGKRTSPGITITDLVKRNFTRTGPNQLWATDITEHPTREG